MVKKIRKTRKMKSKDRKMADEQTSEEQGQQIPRDQQQAYYDFANNAENPIGERMTASLGLVAHAPSTLSATSQRGLSLSRRCSLLRCVRFFVSSQGMTRPR
mgnify:CR=1 FL=1